MDYKEIKGKFHYLFDDLKELYKTLLAIVVKPEILEKSKSAVKMLDLDLDDGKNYLKTADIFILPSYEEGDSIALKEVMALGIPVIISKQCRMPLVQEKGAGEIIETTVDSIKKSLIGLESWDLNEMGLRGRNLIETHFDNKICSQRLFKVYEDIYTGSHNSPDWIISNE